MNKECAMKKRNSRQSSCMSGRMRNAGEQRKLRSLRVNRKSTVLSKRQSGRKLPGLNAKLWSWRLGAMRRKLDDAIRRIIRLNERYSAFPPELARRYDVIEIRRMWNFDEQLRIIEEVSY